ncbi:putative transcriptional regulator [Pseudomonas aeruginosa]|nr:putative transcriptional regulator [Pseudomonas aeruginosa]
MRAERVAGNDYNPNTVAPPEMRLLRLSIESDGFTQPIVAYPQADGRYEVVDGFHRLRVGSAKGALRQRLHGYLPIAAIRAGREGDSERIAATIRPQPSTRRARRIADDGDRGDPAQGRLERGRRGPRTGHGQ